MKTIRGVLLGVILLAACAGPGASGSPPGSPGPDSADAAARLVVASDARFAGIGPLDPELIGQAAWYEAVADDDGWRVTIRIGWGDCPAGCISQHRWIYAVSRAGSVELLGEEGDPLPDATGIRGVVVAGPVCPVETEPPDPDCAPAPVEGAVLVVTDLAGNEVARATSDAEGRFAVELAPGAYHLVPQPVEGYMAAAEPIDVLVEAGAPPTEVALAYDTGIR
jgi:hypothetical protein